MSATRPEEMSVAELALMLANSQDVDDALYFERCIFRKLDETNVSEIRTLFDSTDRYCNVAAIRILSDSGSVGLSNAYVYVDQLFDRDDVLLKRLCINLIQEHNYYQSSANRRMAQYSDFPDNPIKRDVRVWLLWRTPEELREFLVSNQPLSKDIEQLIDLIISLKEGETPLDEFFSKLSTLDIIAFEEFTILAKRKFGRARSVFHTQKRQL